MDIDGLMMDYNKVKELVLEKLVSEGLLEEEDAEEFGDRCQILLYKGKWFSKWFDKNVKVEQNEVKLKESYYMRVIEMREKESEIDRLIRRTNGDG